MYPKQPKSVSDAIQESVKATEKEIYVPKKMKKPIKAWSVTKVTFKK
jgi:hypothetical protein